MALPCKTLQSVTSHIGVIPESLAWLAITNEMIARKNLGRQPESVRTEVEQIR